MACLDMYNSEHKAGHLAPMSPRISFSNDFAETQQMIKQERSSREAAAPVSSDFEFSVSNFSMMSADELFCKGKLLPFKDKQRTLREELLVDDHDTTHDHEVSLRPPKGSSTRWRGLLGLKKTHIGSKKADKSDGSHVDRLGETRRSIFAHEEVHLSSKSTSQELLSEGGGSSCRDVKIET